MLQTEQVEPVNIDDLKKSTQTQVTHLTVDTCHDDKDCWFVIGMEKGNAYKMKIDLHVH
jgi:hypothetical protein